MESHEERLHKLVMQSKTNETKDVVKRKASETDKNKKFVSSSSSSTPSLSSGRLRGSPDLSTYLRLLKDCFTLDQLNQIQSHIIVGGLQQNLVVATKLIHRLSDFGLLSQAQSLFSATPNPDLFLFNVLLRAHAQHVSPVSALSLYSCLLSRRLSPDNFTFAFVVSASTAFRSPESGRQLHAHAILHGFGLDRFVSSALTALYLNFQDLNSARQLFDRCPERDTVSWNTMVSGLVQNCCFQEALSLFEQMVSSGKAFDGTTLSALLPAATELQELEVGRKIHCLSIKTGFDLHACVITGLVSMYGKCGDVQDASFLFNQTQKNRDTVSWNAIISVYSFNADIEASISLFTKMRATVGACVNSSTIVAAIPVFSPFGHLMLSSSIHGYAVKAGMDQNTSIATALMTVYARCNNVESARQLFDQTPGKSLASWNAMISSYTQMGCTEEAIELFQEMQLQDVEPNPVTIASILSACAQVGALTLGKRIHELIVRKGYDSNNVYVSTALIDMYAKCGRVDMAREVFDALRNKNVVSWNAMIAGYGMHGHAKEALELFSDMLRLCTKPTNITFVGLLFACSHAGLVSEGWQLFQSMTCDHSILPKIEHYSCIVDLLGRAGRLDDALNFIRAMPIRPTSGVWGALLAACRVHRNVELASHAAERLFELEPENVGYHVLLSNVYSTSGRWQEAAGVRQLVRSKKMMKTPGYTLIELDEKVHMFTAGDWSHPRSSEIYKMLEKLAGKMMEAGYRAATDLALHDVEEEEKESMLNVHSEKLAIALGLISTEPGTPIRIIKNLRVCLDCHTATKFISKVMHRLIIVRDANRFHHFTDGSCSCGDYW
ncbi:Pentatricopeptide repeat-containing protein [Nymphaea thermarum]|nr:Pentatricopeptide repeat-containing protein [Nymphaea thermarum]